MHFIRKIEQCVFIILKKKIKKKEKRGKSKNKKKDRKQKNEEKLMKILIKKDYRFYEEMLTLGISRSTEYYVKFKKP